MTNEEFHEEERKIIEAIRCCQDEYRMKVQPYVDQFILLRSLQVRPFYIDMDLLKAGV